MSCRFVKQKGITDKSVELLKKFIESSSLRELELFGTSISLRNELLSRLLINMIKQGSSHLTFPYRNVCLTGLARNPNPHP